MKHDPNQEQHSHGYFVKGRMRCAGDMWSLSIQQGRSALCGGNNRGFKTTCSQKMDWFVPPDLLTSLSLERTVSDSSTV